MTMKDIRHIIYLLAFFLAACSDAEEDMPVPDAETCSLTIQLGAEGATETRATVDPNAEDGEFIHSLWVFITDEKGKIEAKFEYTEGDIDPDASVEKDETSTSSGGNVLQWMRTVEGLPTGTKTIYAFANMDNVNEMTELLKTEVGSQLTNVANLVISDPASSVDIDNGAYIPMSVKQVENITGDQIITVRLVRLVARVDAKLTNNRKNEVALGDFTMPGLANAVALFPDGGTVSGTADKTYPFTEKTLEAGASRDFYFYINESKGRASDNPFTVSLPVDNETYTGTLTQTKEIPRNNILPLNLTIGESDLEIVVYVAPIGVYPFALPVIGDLFNPTDGTVSIPEGCSFRVRESGTENYYTLSVEANQSVIAVDATWAHVTALSGLTDIKVTATRGGDVRTITLETTALGDYTRSATLRWGAAPGWSIPIPLSRPECNEGHK